MHAPVSLLASRLHGQLVSRPHRQRRDRGLGARADAELRIDARQVVLDRTDAQVETLSDLLVREALAHEPEDLLLAGAQLAQPDPAPLARTCQVRDHVLGEVGGERDLASRRLPQRGGEFIRGEASRDTSRRAGPQQFHRVGRRAVHDEAHDPVPRMRSLGLAQQPRGVTGPGAHEEDEVRRAGGAVATRAEPGRALEERRDRLDQQNVRPDDAQLRGRARRRGSRIEVDRAHGGIGGRVPVSGPSRDRATSHVDVVRGSPSALRRV